MEFRVLGPLEVIASGGPMRVTGRRRRALLAIMLLHPGEVVTLPRLVDGIWSDRPPESAIFNIRTYVCDFRRQLQQAGDAAARLASHPAGYRLEAGKHELDLLRFEALAIDGQRAMSRHDYQRATDRLGLALGLWRGRPLEDLVDLGTAVVGRMVALEEQRWAVASDWVEARLALGHHHELIPQLRQMVTERPLQEQNRLQLMRALHAAGRTGDALAAYRDARQTAIEELGVEPGPYLREAHTAILNGQSPPGQWRAVAQERLASARRF